MIGRGYCFLFTDLLSWRRSLIQITRPPFFGMINDGEGHLITPVGTKTPNFINCCNSLFECFKLNLWNWVRSVLYQFCFFMCVDVELIVRIYSQ